MTNSFDVDEMIEELWKAKNKPSAKRILSKNQVLYLCAEALKIFQKQTMLLELIPPLTVCGDIHGQFNDLLRTFEAGGSPEITNYLFLGDYVDRGSSGVNVIALLFCYKIKYPNNFFLLRGNHESPLVNKEYGFYDECKTLYDVSVWKTINDVFGWLPVAATIDSRILCVHAGISPALQSIQNIKALKRPLEIPDEGLLCDLVWSDPDPNVETWGPNDRGTSVTFGLAPLKALLKKMNLDLIVRGHQSVDTGYALPFAPDRSMVTIFGAPNYMGEFRNRAALLHISDKMVCTFSILEPIIQPQPKSPTRRSATDAKYRNPKV